MKLAGQPDVVPEGIEPTAPMGRCAPIGVSLGESSALGMALAFIQRNAKELPFGELLSRKFPFEEVNQAFDLAMQRKIARASIVL